MAETQIRRIEKRLFGTANGKPVDLYTLRNSCGMVMKVTTFGGIVTALETPDRYGAVCDIVLGFNDLDSYIKGHPYFGAIIGRYGNRIANGRFLLNGKQHVLAKNNGPNNLHGGENSFDKRVWDAKEIVTDSGAGLVLSYCSRDNEEGFPGTLTATVTYLLTDENELKIDYAAVTDKPTVCNLTHHSYFNLAGEGSGTIIDTEITIHADAFTPVDETLIPSGEIRPVAGTPFDFRKPVAIGARIGADDDQLRIGGGYDHNWVLRKSDGTVLSLAATARHPGTGRFIEVLTTEPGIQMYSGNFLDGTLMGKSGSAYVHRGGFCLETQHYPDSPNKPSFPSTILNPGQDYSSSTVYRFSAE
ncbi:MAG: galactose mutarotase [Chitinispirillaceae bacterium]|jgi:aldose 1-epimerase|nr:galactose mutarotase [Chitinispirillaceae bacterium]